jgi:excisionase family DNA binding protein
MVNPRQKMEHTNGEDEVLKHFEECLRILAKKIVMIIIRELQDVSKDVKLALVNTDSPLKSKKLTYSVVEVAEILSLSRSATYEAIRTKQIPSIRFGRRIKGGAQMLLPFHLKILIYSYSSDESVKTVFLPLTGFAKWNGQINPDG